MWFKQRTANSKLGELLRPYFERLMLSIFKSDQWRYTLVRWAWAPMFVIQKPAWFSRLIVTICTGSENESIK